MSVEYELSEAVVTVEPGAGVPRPPASELLAAAVGPELAHRLLFALSAGSSTLPAWGPLARVGGPDS